MASVALLCSALPVARAQEEVHVDLGSTVSLRVGQDAVIESEGIVAKFEGVTEDSRCPADVVCVWQGQATIAMSVQVDGGDAQDLMLTVGDEQYPSAMVGEYSVRVVQLRPYPVSSGQIGPGDYTAELVISKPAANSNGVIVRAVNDDEAVVVGWNLEQGKGTFVRLAKDDGEIRRTVYRFVPWAAECSDQQARECMDSLIPHETEVFGATSSVRIEVIGDELDLFIGGGISTFYTLDIKDIRTYE